MPKIFISYRQKDTMAVAGRIFDRLKGHFGPANVFMDVDGLPIGVDFRRHLTDAVGGCDIFLTLIGEQWLSISHNGQRRLDDPADFVRIEVETALQRGIPLIPVLVGAASMPRAEQLPASLADLSFHHAAPLDPGRRFDNDINEIIRGLEKWTAKLAPAAKPQPAASAAGPAPTPLPKDVDAFQKGVNDQLQQWMAQWGKNASPELSHLLAGMQKTLDQEPAAPAGPTTTAAPVVQLFEAGEFEAEERLLEAARVKAAEEGLSVLVLQCLERTQGKPDKQANDAIAAYCREHSLDPARASAIVKEVRSEWSKPKQPGQVWTNSLGMKFAWIPPGKFWMGGGDGKPGDHEVDVAQAFYLGIYPMTQGQWQRLMGNNPSHFSGADRNDLPVEQVSCDDAQEFIKKLNTQETEASWVYRLPTEAQWEYACRGAPATREECAFDFYFDKPTNDLSSEQANFDGNYPAGKAVKGKYLQRTTKVGSYWPNRLGIFDLHGNVWEWCDDLYAGGLDRVVRGGSWCHFAGFCRAAYRDRRAPSDRNRYLGFRLARVPSASK